MYTPNVLLFYFYNHADACFEFTYPAQVSSQPYAGDEQGGSIPGQGPESFTMYRISMYKYLAVLFMVFIPEYQMMTSSQ